MKEKNRGLSLILSLILLRVACLLFFLVGSLQAGAQKPDIKLRKSAKTIELGDSVTITWKTRKAKSLFLEGKEEQLPLSGKIVVYPDTSTVYKFIARKKKKEKKRSAKITVLIPEIDEFTGPESATDESPFELKWNTGNVSTVYMPSHADSLDLNGKRSFRIDTTTTYTLVAENRFGKKTEKTHTVNIIYVEHIDTSDLILLGDTSVITWKFKNTRYVEIAGKDQKFNPVDTVSLAPDTTCGYDVFVHRDNNDTLNYRINITVVKPHIVFFKGDKTIFRGEEAELKWQAVNVKYVNLIGIKDSLPPSGTYTIKPKLTETYKLEIEHLGKKQTREHQVRVVQRSYVNDAIKYQELKKDIRIDFEIFATDLSRYPEEVKLYVLVVDTNGNFIQDLAPPFGTTATARKYFLGLVEQFAGGKRQKISSFDVKEIREKITKPYDINLTLDYSGSMQGSIRTLEKACKQFVKNKNPDDRLSIVRFSDSLAVEIPLTKDADEILKTVEFKGLKDFGGGTALYAGADEGLITLKNSNRNKQQILFTDGYENASFAYFMTRKFTAQGLARKAFKAKTRINIVTIGNGINEPLLNYLAIVTGGNYYNISKAKEVLMVMSELPRINRNYYVVTYKPVIHDGERSVQLVYFNQQDDKMIANRKVFVGDDFDLNKYEFTDDAYWNTPSKSWGTLRPVSPPQAVALFDYNKDNLLPEHFNKIDKYSEYLMRNHKSKAVIYGHTDQVGNDDHCNNLSKARALAVRNYIISKGVLPERLIIEACGKKNPLWQIEDQDWKAHENRRVEILLLE